MKNIKHLLLGIIIISMTSCSVFVGPATANQALVTKNPIGSKVGVIKQKVWLGIFPMHADLSITAVAKKAKITKVASVDVDIYPGLFNLWKTYQTTVTGTNSEVEEAPKGKKKKKSRSRSKGRR